MKYYKPNTSPLVEVEESEIILNDELYDELGRFVRKIHINDEDYIVEITDSVLHEGEVLSELTELQLQLFWALSRTKRSKLNEDQDRIPRPRILS